MMWIPGHLFHIFLLHICTFCKIRMMSFNIPLFQMRHIVLSRITLFSFTYIFFSFEEAYHIRTIVVSSWDNMLHKVLTSTWHWPLTRGQFIFSSSILLFLGQYVKIFLPRLTIFGPWVCHQIPVCNAKPWTQYDLHHWPQGQITGYFGILFCWSHYIFSFYIDLPYLDH